MSGTRIGPESASAMLVEGAAAEMNEPKATAELATRMIAQQQ